MLRKRYRLSGERGRSWPEQYLIIVAVILIALVGVGYGIRSFYHRNLGPVSESVVSQEFIIRTGMLSGEVAEALAEEKLIRNKEVFQWYIKATNASDKIQAGTYRLQPSMSTPEIVEIITKGKVTNNLVTIYPGKRLDEVRTHLINSGFDATEVDTALDPTQHSGHAALVDKPAGASLEGFLYPESFERNTETTAKDIIEASLDEMSKRLTPELRTKFAQKNLTMYEGLVLASIVEQEAHRTSDRKQIAQVFLSRLQINMRLESDPTAKYGAVLAGQEPSLQFESAYNTYQHKGLPPTPISNVTEDSLQAVANPADTDWVYFVAGDDEKTYFSKTLEEHEALTEEHCTTLCGN